MYAVAADLHLSPYIWKSRTDIRGDSYHAMRYIARWCAEKQCDLLLLGDVFDSSHPDARSVQIFRESVRLVEDGGGRVYFLQGNHDRSEVAWCHAVTGGVDCGALPLHRQLRVLRDGSTVVGLDYAPSNQLAEMIAELPDASAWCFHQTWFETSGLSIAPSFLATVGQRRVPRLVLSGDYHVATIANPGNNDRLTIVSLGSTVMQSVDEELRKSFVVVRDGSVVDRREFIPSRPVCRFAINEEQELLEVLDEFPGLAARLWDESRGYDLPEDLRRPLAVIVCSASVAGSVDRLEEAARKHGMFVLVRLRASQKGSDLIQEFSRSYESDNDGDMSLEVSWEEVADAARKAGASPEAIQLLHGLWCAASPSAYLADMWSEFDPQ